MPGWTFRDIEAEPAWRISQLIELLQLIDEVTGV
jgi:hypothetical protein